MIVAETLMPTYGRTRELIDLQWGRDLIVAETRIEDDAEDVDTSPFNGAAT